MKMKKVAAALVAIAGLVLLALSIMKRDEGALWMPLMFFVAMLCELLAVAMLTYDAEEAVAVRKRMDEAAESKARS